MQVTLEPGDLLYVPRHWWHYVESIGDHPTVSINTWVDLVSREIIVTTNEFIIDNAPVINFTSQRIAMRE